VGAAGVDRARVAAVVRSTADEVSQRVTFREIDAALIAASAAVIAPDQTLTPVIVSAIRRYRLDVDDFVTIDDRHHTVDQFRAEVSRRLKHALPVELVRPVVPQARDDARTICAYCFRLAAQRHVSAMEAREK